MYRSCKYCGKIHDSLFVCPSKPKKDHKVDKDNQMAVDIRKFRDSGGWRKKRVQIQERDMHLCQVCMRKLFNTINQYTYVNTSVHHIIPLIKDWSKRLDDMCLITLCSMHHAYADDGFIPVNILLEIVAEQEGKSTPPIRNYKI